MTLDKMLCFFSIVLVFGGCIAETSAGPPKTEFDAIDFDFGRIPPDAVVTHIYKLTNSGGDSIVIEKVRPYCGCTKAPLTKTVIYPGETAPIELRFNSRGYRGRAKKSAAVTVKIGENTEKYRLTFVTQTDTGNIPFSTGEVGVYPYAVEFTDSIKTAKITITNRTAAKRVVRVDDYQSDRLKLSWNKKTLGPKKEAVLEVTRLVPADGIVASITIESPGRYNTRITIPVSERKATSRSSSRSGVHRSPDRPMYENPWQQQRK